MRRSVSFQRRTSSSLSTNFSPSFLHLSSNPLVFSAAFVFSLRRAAATTSKHHHHYKNNMTSNNNNNNNPLLARSPLPFQFPQFDKIRNEHFAPAFEAAMAEHNREIAAIAGNTAEPPTFDNTLVALERSGATLMSVSKIFQNLNSCNTNDDLQKLDVELSPKLQAHKDAIYMNEALWRRVEAVINKHKNNNENDNDNNNEGGSDGCPNAESRRLLWRYEQDFVRAGAKLNAADKEKLKALNGDIAKLETHFQQAVLAEVGDSAVWFADAADLDGFTPEQLEQARVAADEAFKKEQEQAAGEEKDTKNKKKRGNYLVKLRNTTQQPALPSLNKPESRRRVLAASMARGNRGGKHDTREIISQLARKRAERAPLLGYKNHAEYTLAEEMTKTPAGVKELLMRVSGPSLAMARKEAGELRKLAGRDDITAADWDFWTEKLRAKKYSFDDSVLKPYFELNRVIDDGLFFFAKKFYGISFVERSDLPKYHPSIKIYDVMDEGGKQIALFVMDLYARDVKQGGAWMCDYAEQANLLSQLPIIANHSNFAVPTAPGEPTLLSLDDVRTIFHEWGHGAHGFFSNVKFPRFSGTSVCRSLVEFPSQVTEIFFLEKEILKNYARHYKTGEPIPDEFIDKVHAAEKFNKGYETAEFASACLLDQCWHMLTPEQVPSADKVLEFEEHAIKESGMYEPLVPPRYRSTYFSHIFAGGYSAGYWSYLGSQVLDAYGEQYFKENGGVTRANGDRFRQMVLSKGGTEDPHEMVENYFGCEPTIQPLLKRLGMEEAS